MNKVIKNPTTTVDAARRGTILGGQHGLSEEDTGRRGTLGAELGGFGRCSGTSSEGSENSVMGSEDSGTSSGDRAVSKQRTPGEARERRARATVPHR